MFLWLRLLPVVTSHPRIGPLLQMVITIITQAPPEPLARLSRLSRQSHGFFAALTIIGCCHVRESQSRCSCGRGEPSPGADVAGVGQSRCRVGGVSPVPVQMWQGRAQSRDRWDNGGPSELW